MIKAMLHLPATANAIVNNTPFAGFVNAELIAVIQNAGSGNAILYVGPLQITVAIQWLQNNWPPLFLDRMEEYNP